MRRAVHPWSLRSWSHEITTFHPGPSASPPCQPVVPDFGKPRCDDFHFEAFIPCSFPVCSPPFLPLVVLIRLRTVVFPQSSLISSSATFYVSRSSA